MRSIRFVLSRIGEASTWQGIGALAVIFVGREYAGLPWGEVAALAAVVSGAIKVALPDRLRGRE